MTKVDIVAIIHNMKTVGIRDFKNNSLLSNYLEEQSILGKIKLAENYNFKIEQKNNNIILSFLLAEANSILEEFQYQFSAE